MSVENDVIEVLADTLSLSEGELDKNSAVLGAIPEFDSMAVVSVLTALEERYGFIVDDDEIDASIFETVGSLAEFVSSKV